MDTINPTAQDVKAKRAQLTAAELEELRSRFQQGRRTAKAVVKRMPEGAEKVLSYAQQRLWFLDQFEPGSDNYNVLLALRLRGEFSQSALQTALDALVARHEALRTSFGSVQGRPLVQVHDAVELPFQVVDLCHLVEPEREAAAREQATALAAIDGADFSRLRELAPDKEVSDVRSELPREYSTLFSGVA